MDKVIKFPDRYKREAMLYPTVLALLPLWILFYSVQDYIFNSSFLVKLTSSSLLWIVFSYLFVDVVRNLGKHLEAKIFNNELFFPTTELLLHSNSFFSKEKKSLIYSKIKKDFDISLCDIEQEKKKENVARTRIVEAVGLIRQRIDKGRLLIDYNIRYGFWRNLIAVSPFATAMGIITAIILLVLLNNYNSGILILFFSLCYLGLWISTESLLNFFSKQYANQLFLEYLTK